MEANLSHWSIRVLDEPGQMRQVEELQRRVWPGSETEIVPAHLLLAAAHNGGLVLGAYSEEDQQTAETGKADDEISSEQAGEQARMIGFVFGFPGVYPTADGPRLKHHSHMAGVDPAYRDQGIGFALKRAQWQMVRHQGVDRITWTYDPLLSRNAYLNISQLGSVCNTYLRDEYGELRDGLNAGVSTDRFQVDWWVNSNRVNRRLSKRPRLHLDLAHFLAAGTRIVNPSQIEEDQLPHPGVMQVGELVAEIDYAQEPPPIFLLEIPGNFQRLKSADLELAQAWRLHTRSLFEAFFSLGYLATDFIHLPGVFGRSFYVLSHGQSFI